jgi:hypothetical protein
VTSLFLEEPTSVDENLMGLAILHPEKPYSKSLRTLDQAIHGSFTLTFAHASRPRQSVP